MVPVPSSYNFIRLVGMQNITVKSCSACSSMQFLFIHIMGLVVCEAEFGVTLPGLLYREFTAAKNK